MPTSLTRRTLSFARLPLEIRQQVYEYVLTTAPYGNTGLLRVCSQIYSEAQQYLFKRPVTFQSQSDFLHWVHSVPQEHRYHVTTVQLRLDDMSSDEVFRIFRRRLALTKVVPTLDSPPIIPHQEECDRQMAMIEAALRSLPNIHDFTILQPNSSASGPFLYMHTTFLRLIARIYPRLRKLNSHATEISLSPLQSYQNLRRLTFCAWSTSTPLETALAFEQIPSLQAIEVFGPPPGLAFAQRPEYTGALRVQSFNSDVLRSMHPLRSFAIWDFQDDPYDNQPIVTDDLFDVLGTHHSSLRTLKICTKSRPWKSSEKFAEYLWNSSLARLECLWDSTVLGIAAILPRSLETFSVLSSPLAISPLVDGLLERRRELPVMRKMIVQTPTPDDPAFEECMSECYKRLMRRAIHLSCERAQLHPLYRGATMPSL